MLSRCPGLTVKMRSNLLIMVVCGVVFAVDGNHSAAAGDREISPTPSATPAASGSPVAVATPPATPASGSEETNSRVSGRVQSQARRLNPRKIEPSESAKTGGSPEQPIRQRPDLKKRAEFGRKQSASPVPEKAMTASSPSPSPAPSVSP